MGIFLSLLGLLVGFNEVIDILQTLPSSTDNDNNISTRQALLPTHFADKKTESQKGKEHAHSPTNTRNSGRFEPRCASYNYCPQSLLYSSAAWSV